MIPLVKCSTVTFAGGERMQAPAAVLKSQWCLAPSVNGQGPRLMLTRDTCSNEQLKLLINILRRKTE